MEKKLYGKHSNGETVEFEVMGVIDSTTWNEYKRDERENYITHASTHAEKLREQYLKYEERERKQREELEKVNIKFHTAIAEVAEHLGGKGEVVIRIGKDAVTLVPDEQYVDTNVIKKKYRTTNAEEKRGLSRMKAIIGYYRRKTRIEKSLARTICYKEKKFIDCECEALDKWKYKNENHEIIIYYPDKHINIERLEAEMIDAKKSIRILKRKKQM